uniref:HAT C-terminal dimerisation domain-containing protein n=1 Tax=Oreochromis niloticus TaxID=8128 RepID=I3KZS0_ORENI
LSSKYHNGDFMYHWQFENHDLISLDFILNRTPSLHFPNFLYDLLFASATEVSERREYLERIVAVTCFLGKQGISFRGHDETEESDNKGNFRECMTLLEKFDPFLQRYTPPSNTTYISCSSQNEMIECCSQEVTAAIVHEIKESQMYAIMADEARDGRTEQLALCVRYVSVEGVVKERFLALTEMPKFDAASINTAIENQLQEKGIERLKCVAQTYDGAAVMSRTVGGVQAHFQKKHPEAIYVHCYAHELNLILCHTCRAVTETIEFFNMLESLHSFFSASLVNHHKFMDTQKKLGLEQSELAQLSNTRWACQVRSVTAVLNNFPAIIECLSSINTPIAVGLKAKLCKFSSVYLLIVLKDLLSVTECLHRYLQKETIDIAQAQTYKDAVVETLKQKRSDATAIDLHARTRAMCEANQIAVLEQSSGQRQKKKRMDGFVVESTCGAGSEVCGSSVSEELKRKLLFPCLDRMISELEKRFSGISQELLNGIQACSPTSNHFLSEPHLSALALHYHIELQSEEVTVAKNFLKLKSEAGAIPDMSTMYSLLDNEIFPTLKTVIQVALTIPVSSCSCERSFSVLRRLHTWLRRTMGQSRLQHLAVMSVEKEMLERVDHQKVIDRFASLKVRRHRLK